MINRNGAVSSEPGLIHLRIGSNREARRTLCRVGGETDGGKVPLVLVGEEEGTEVTCRVYEGWNVGEEVKDALNFLCRRPSTKHGRRV
jgi:hypothetical protein